jgi:hypothetical protein
MTYVSKRLGHTSTRMVDSTYVSQYEDASRAVADAIDELPRAPNLRETKDRVAGVGAEHRPP